MSTSSHEARGTPIVYILDDDVSVRESLELLVEAAGWQSQAFASAREFLSAPRLAPGCVVLDVTLPDLGGLELLERIAPEGAGMPVILISGYAEIPMTVQAMNAGELEFLTKPLDDVALLRAIQRAIELSRAMLDQAVVTPLSRT